MDSIVVQIALLFILILLNGIFSCAEIAVISSNDARLAVLAKEGNKKAKRLLALTDNPSQFLSTIQIGITLVGFLTSAFAANTLSVYLVDLITSFDVPLSRSVISIISILIITIVLSYFTLIFGELVPKRIGMNKAESIAMKLSGVIYALSKITKPAVWFLTASTNLVLRLIGIDPNEENDVVTEEEIRMMVNLGREKGTIDDDERSMIHNVFDFDDMHAEDVMMHRSNMPVLWMDNIEEWSSIFATSPLYTLPVCNEDQDDIIGLLDIKAFNLIKNNDPKHIKSLFEEPVFIPSYFKLTQVFKNMKYRKVNIAIMVDEHGGVDGIITMDDILSEIVGDYTDEESGVIEVTKDYIILNGNVTLDDLKNDYQILIEDDLTTIGAVVVEKLGYLPTDGPNDLKIDIGIYPVEILEIKNRKIEKLKLLTPIIIEDNENTKNDI